MYNKVNLETNRTIYDPISAMELSRNLKDYLIDKGVDNVNTKFQIENKGIKVMVAIDSKSPLLEINPVAKLSPVKVRDPYTMTDKLKGILSPFLDPNQEPTITTYTPDDRNIRVIIHLIPKKVLDVILPGAPSNCTLSISRVIPQKSNPLIFFELKKNRKKDFKNKENNNNNNKSYYRK